MKDNFEYPIEKCCTEDDRCPKGGGPCTKDTECEDSTLNCLFIFDDNNNDQMWTCESSAVSSVDVRFHGNYTVFERINYRTVFLSDCTESVRRSNYSTVSCVNVTKGSIVVKFHATDQNELNEIGKHFQNNEL
eukprot:UN25757